MCVTLLKKDFYFNLLCLIFYHWQSNVVIRMGPPSASMYVPVYDYLSSIAMFDRGHWCRPSSRHGAATVRSCARRVQSSNAAPNASRLDTVTSEYLLRSNTSISYGQTGSHIVFHEACVSTVMSSTMSRMRESYSLYPCVCVMWTLVSETHLVRNIYAICSQRLLQ